MDEGAEADPLDDAADAQAHPLHRDRPGHVLRLTHRAFPASGSSRRHVAELPKGMPGLYRCLSTVQDEAVSDRAGHFQLTRPAPAVIDLDGLHALVGVAPRPRLSRRRPDASRRCDRLRGARRPRTSCRSAGPKCRTARPTGSSAVRTRRASATPSGRTRGSGASSRRDAALAGAPERRQRHDVEEEPPPEAVRLRRRPLVRPARDRHPGPRVPRRARTSTATTPRAARARSSSPSTAGARRARASATRWAPGPRAESGLRPRADRDPRRRAPLRRRGRAASAAREMLASCPAGRRAEADVEPRPSRHRTSAPTSMGRTSRRRPPRAARAQPRAPALGRRRRALPHLRQLHDGLPDLLLHLGRRRRPTSTGARPSAGARWDSCFSPEYSYIHGGSVRPSARSRYRQWLTHKLGTWIDQFGTSGCVGCGRCITWCPVGIDITEEVAAIRATDGEVDHADA